MLRRDGSVRYVGTNYSGRNASWYDPNMRLPYVATWSGGIQYQLTNSVVWKADIRVLRASDLLNNWNINVLPLDVAANDPARLAADFPELPELQAVSAVQQHQSLLKLRPQHLSWRHLAG